MQTMTNTPDFQALKASLVNNIFNGYTTPVKQTRQPVRETEPCCQSGKEAYPSIADVMKAKNSCGSPVRFKSYYRCSSCGQYHFSRKEEEPTRLARYNRKKGNICLKQMVSMYSSDREEMEYVPVF